MAELTSKTYIDRAIQTESPALLVTVQAVAAPVEVVAAAPDAASQASILDSSSLVRHLQKPHFALNLPSSLAAASLTSRIVSLPETAPPVVLKPAAKGRLSLPESQPLLPDIRDDETAASDYVESSISTDLSLTSSDISIQYPHPRRTQYPAKHMPQTPSPPSSPESVMIINNDAHISQSFLTNKHRIADNVFKEDNGWMTWTDSPPRPIPALHGPLSLPYARCPSGAEGTIMEGEDMSRVVWGLGGDSAPEESVDFKPTFPRDRRHSNAGRPTPRIPDSKPMSHNPVKHQTPCTGTITHSPFLPGAPQAHPNRRGQQEQHGAPSDSEYNGLGLKFFDPPHSRQSRLSQPMEPFFTPTLSTEPSYSPYNTPRIFIDSRETPGRTSQVIIPSGPRLSALDIAQQYRLKQQLQQVLLTPPDSTGAEWNSTYPNNHLSLDDLNLNDDNQLYSSIFRHPPDQRSNKSHDFATRRCLPNSRVDESQELRDFVFNQIASPHISNSPIFIPEHQERPTALDHHQFSSPLELFSPDFVIPSTRREPSSYPSPQVSQSPYAPPSPISPDIDPSASAIRMPRSVPFARLMQRRLSAVPEEDENPKYSPKPRERRPRPAPMVDLANQTVSKGFKVSSRFNGPMPLRDVEIESTKVRRTDKETLDKENGGTAKTSWVKVKRSA